MASTAAAGATPHQARPAPAHRHELSSREHERSSKAPELPSNAHELPHRRGPRAACFVAPARPRAGPILSRRAGARRRGRRERRHQRADVAELVPPEARRGVAGGRRPDRHTPRTTSHRRGGASDQSVIRMRRPRAGREAAERCGPRDAVRRACGRPRCAACRRWVRAPGAGARTRKPANASGATTGATVRITRLSVSSAFEDRPHRHSQGRRRRPLERSPLGCGAGVRSDRRTPHRPAHRLSVRPLGRAKVRRGAATSSWLSGTDDALVPR